ncbi:MAG TPA: hypothetical protein VNO26_05395 [Candidatus Limnocylindria bacterium]|nr:hypothetical protein [Candidatus Limnocylindria bacterium]
MPLDQRDAAALDTLVADCRRLFGERLLALALYGEAATAAYRPLVSPLETVLVLDRIGIADLRALRARVKAWQRLRLDVPLVLDREHLAGARDVFPLEMLELHERHRLLHGADDPFAALGPPSASQLRLELEEQLRGKLLHLRASYLALAGRDGLPELLRAVGTTLDVVLRGLLALAGRPRPDGAADVLRALGELDGVPLAALTRLDRWTSGEQRLTAGELDELFAAVHDELAALVGRIERR